jgi:hypothetical protein
MRPISQSGVVQITVERDGREIDLDVQAYYLSDPGVTAGPPERCREPMKDSAIEGVWLAGTREPWTGELTEAEEDEVFMDLDADERSSEDDYLYELERDRRAGLF